MRSVVFCSSQRFKKELAEFISELKRSAKERGVSLVVFEPEFDADEYDSERLCTLSEKQRLEDPAYKAGVAGKVYDHLFRKVKVADVCFVFNKDGYVGSNTNGELFAAAMAGKLIYALEDQTMAGHYPHDLYEEPSSRKFVHDVISTPEELLMRLL
ncbi:hypothetical protein ACFLY5_00790 [Patescibacteria group bacterium]